MTHLSKMVAKLWCAITSLMLIHLAASCWQILVFQKMFVAAVDRQYRGSKHPHTMDATWSIASVAANRIQWKSSAVQSILRFCNGETSPCEFHANYLITVALQLDWMHSTWTNMRRSLEKTEVVKLLTHAQALSSDRFYWMNPLCTPSHMQFLICSLVSSGPILIRCLSTTYFQLHSKYHGQWASLNKHRWSKTFKTAMLGFLCCFFFMETTALQSVQRHAIQLLHLLFTEQIGQKHGANAVCRGQGLQGPSSNSTKCTWVSHQSP